MEMMVLGIIGFEVERRPKLKKKVMRVLKKIPGYSVSSFEKAVSGTAGYLINAWPDFSGMVKGEKK
jgi:hypothetical protein